MNISKKKQKEMHAKRTRTVLWYVFVTAGAIIMLLPFAWMISTSLKMENDIFTMPIKWLPSKITFDNYVEALKVVPIFKCMLNTLIVAIPKILGEVFVSALVAFGFARFNFKGKNVLFMIMLATMMLPYEVTMIPTFMGWSALGFTREFDS